MPIKSADLAEAIIGLVESTTAHPSSVEASSSVETKEAAK